VKDSAELRLRHFISIEETTALGWGGMVRVSLSFAGLLPARSVWLLGLQQELVLPSAEEKDAA
jgi:hypothetical protein